MNRHSPTPQGLEARRLSVPGTQVHLEPVPGSSRSGRPLREPRPEEGGLEKESPEGKRLLTGEIPSGTGLSHTWLRQKALFAEMRALRDGEERTIVRNDHLKFRLPPLQVALLREAVKSGQYRSCSDYLRAVATGRHRLAHPVAKAGAIFYWACAHVGDEVRTEGWEALRDLLRSLFGMEEIREVLRLARRHLRAGQLHADGKLASEEDLPPPPEATRQSASSFPEPPISVRLCRARKELIRECASYSRYDGMSSYVVHMALGWDRNERVLAQGVVIARWILKHLGTNVSREQWERLGNVFRQRFDVFLLGAKPCREPDVDGALRRGAEHLLGATLETVAEETEISV
jgi:hypothetical protein